METISYSPNCNRKVIAKVFLGFCESHALNKGRDVNRPVPVWVHGGPGPRTVKEKVDLDPFRNQFLGSGTETVNETWNQNQNWNRIWDGDGSRWKMIWGKP